MKVRRVMQIIEDLTAAPFESLRVLDLGCGEGVYAVEAGLRGADVLAIDARTQRMDEGAALAARHGLENVRFVQDDVRGAAAEKHGLFDVVLCLGILYHLDTADVLPFLEHVHGLCSGLTIVDTLITVDPDTAVVLDERTYEGERYREHDDDDSEQLRRSRVLKSIDNTYSFKFTRSSLVRALHDTGFSSVFECRVPPEPGKAADRVTVAARRGRPVTIHTYPWINGLSESEVAEAVDRFAREGG